MGPRPRHRPNWPDRRLVILAVAMNAPVIAAAVAVMTVGEHPGAQIVQATLQVGALLVVHPVVVAAIALFHALDGAQLALQVPGLAAREVAVAGALVDPLGDPGFAVVDPAARGLGEGGGDGGGE